MVLNFEDLGFYVYETTVLIGDRYVSGWLYTQFTYSNYYEAYLAGFVAYANEPIDIWFVEESIAQLGDNKYVLIYNEMINTMHYIAFDKYVYYSVDDYEICFDIVDYAPDKVNYNYGYLYNYDAKCAEYDPDIGSEIDLSSQSTIFGIDYDFALDYYTAVIANQDQYAVALDSVTVIAIDVAALNESILNGQEEAYLGISSEQIYLLESRLSNVSFYYVDEMGNLQALDTQDILDRYEAEAHKNDVTFLQVLNYVIIGAQIVVGAILCCVPGGQGIGIPLYLSGALGLIAEVCAPYIQQLFLGLDTITNGYGAMAIGFRLISKWPAGTIAGIVCIAIGAATAFVGFNDVAEALNGDNLIKDVWGMSEDSYQTLSFALNVLSTVATITGNVLNSSLTSKPIKPNKVPDGTAQPKPIKQTDVTTDAVKTGKGVNNPKVKDAVVSGQKAHTYARDHSLEVYGVPRTQTERIIRSGMTKKSYVRPDAIDLDNNIVYDLKPNNPKAIERAKKQLQEYVDCATDYYKREFTAQLVVYDIVDGHYVFTKINLF